MHTRLLYSLAILLRGVGQVIFLENTLSGALLLVGLCCTSLGMGLCALLGTAISTLTALACRLPAPDIRRGLYGFNGTLVGIAVAVFFELNVMAFLCLSLGAAATVEVGRLLGRLRVLPILTAPFILVTWELLLLPSLGVQLNEASSAATILPAHFSPFHALSFSFGQIMLQGSSLLTGLCFLLGIACHSPKMAAQALFAAGLSLAALAFRLPLDSINGGLMGYNVILAFLAVAAILPMNTHRWEKAIVAALLALLLQWGGLHWEFTTLTAPFVLSVWTVVGIDCLSRKP